MTFNQNTAVWHHPSTPCEHGLIFKSTRKLRTKGKNAHSNSWFKLRSRLVLPPPPYKVTLFWLKPRLHLYLHLTLPAALFSVSCLRGVSFSSSQSLKPQWIPAAWEHECWSTTESRLIDEHNEHMKMRRERWKWKSFLLKHLRFIHNVTFLNFQHLYDIIRK